MPVLVVYGGRRMHYALLLVEVEGEWGARDLLLLMLRGDRRHRRVHPRLWTHHSTSMSIIIRSRRMRSRRTRSSLNFSWVISIRRGMSSTMGIRLSFTRDISLSSLLSNSMSSLLSSNSISSICRGWYGGWGWGLSRGPYDLSLLPDFGKHVAFMLWNHKTVSIIALFNLMIFYYSVKFILRRICHVYFTYLRFT